MKQEFKSKTLSKLDYCYHFIPTKKYLLLRLFTMVRAAIIIN